MPMSGEEFGVAATAAATLLSAALVYANQRDKNSKDARAAEGKAETDRLALALDGFDKLVEDMRTEIDRGRTERESLTAEITDLKACLAERDEQISDLRAQVQVLTEKAVGIA